MAAAAAVFHVEFGINETLLTKALESCDYASAENIILTHSFTSYLDEGCYQRTPLYITLCGKSNEDQKFPRNLQMATKLVQNGANVNFRVPETYIGCEYMGPGKSGLELLVEMYNSLTMHPSHYMPSPQWDATDEWDPHDELVIGSNGKIITSKEDLTDEILELVFVMLTHGGDTSIKDENHMTLLHRTVIYSADPRLLHMLCESSAGLNSPNLRQATPLCSLCNPFPLGVNDFLSCFPDYVDPYTSCSSLERKEDFVEFLASQKDIQIDMYDKYNRTPLFYCMVRGNVKCAEILLKQGADPTVKGQVWDSFGDKRFLSPLFATMFSQRVIASHQDKHYASHSPQISFIAPLVDAGYFDKSEIVTELVDILTDQYPDLQSLKVLGSSLIHAVLGHSRISLRQRCCRLIFKQLFMHRNKHASECMGRNLANEINGINQPEVFQSYLDNQLNAPVLEEAIEKLHLPSDTVTFFQVELFRERLYSMLRQMRWFSYYDPDFDGSCYFCDSDNSTSDECDSDLEYW